MATFRKQEDCPASQELLSFQTGSMPVATGRTIAAHLRTCEFCNAEVEFYEHYPQSDEQPEPPESARIPEPLAELAESILNRKHGSQTMAAMMLEVETTNDRRRNK